MWMLGIALAAVAVPIAWYGPGLLRHVVRGQREFSRVKRVVRDEAERLEHPLVVGMLELDRRRLVEDHLNRGDAGAAEAILLDRSGTSYHLFELIDGPSRALSDVTQPVHGDRYLRAFTCVPCGEKRFPGSALVVTRNPAIVDATWPGGRVHVECACPEGHKLPDCEATITVN